MKKQLLLNKLSLIVATTFFAFAAFQKNIYFVLLGLAMMGYSIYKIRKLKIRK
ncbi:hypothetical protein SAMN02745163_02933 [Clostridium cavendishii DSM 21758]|uniref:Uncharacterized protein n=1 Tax=Clostridium cavendishii DSM 21758 TaxID=1121302 RepID=A0A1M6NKE1_9CLOT|nr:hypothetical protein [Clostridium cavendishii]SHJ96153.1 hypothetical protein SAMN02745163_02933 [Clostridium cavendishii DSM 21758]